MTLRELLREKERLIRDHQQAQMEWHEAEGITEKTKCFQRACAIFEEFERLPSDEECELTLPQPNTEVE